MWAIIGSSGFEQFDEFEVLENLARETPFGLCSNGLQRIKVHGKAFLFLPRTSSGENVLPSNIKNRANIYALKKHGATSILALSSVRSLRDELEPGDMVVPYQYIDRTKLPRYSTFCDDNLLGYVSLAHPISEDIANIIKDSAKFEFRTHFGQAYVCVEGPQFPTMLDAKCFQAMGAGVIGMTAFPEYALAREAGMHYLPCNFIVDYLPWSDSTPNIDSVLQIRHTNYEKALKLIEYVSTELESYGVNDCQELGLSNSLNVPLEQLTPKQQSWFKTIVKSNSEIIPEKIKKAVEHKLDLSQLHSGVQPMPKKLQEFLSFINKYKPASGQKETLEMVRKNASSLSFYSQNPIDLPSVRNFTVKNGDRKVPVRLYHPHPEDSLPVMMYVHGGGFVSGTLDSFDTPCRALAKATNRVVLAVDYHLAPEHKFPAGVDDVYEVGKWVYENANNLRAIRDNLVIAGDSSGGCYAALVTSKAKRTKEFDVAGQVLIYPTTDMSHAYGSMEEFKTGYLLEADKVRWYNTLYLPEGIDKTSPDVSPLYATNLADLPPTMIMTSGYDPLKEEGLTYAAKLSENGVKVHHYHFDNMIHAFLNFGKLVPNELNVLYDRVAAFTKQLN
jgi:acetyl esterase/lipase/purine nucleoside phosphorylase